MKQTIYGIQDTRNLRTRYPDVYAYNTCGDIDGDVLIIHCMKSKISVSKYLNTNKSYRNQYFYTSEEERDKQYEKLTRKNN